MNLQTIEKTALSLNGAFTDAKTGKVIKYDPEFETVLKLAVVNKAGVKVATTHKAVTALRHHATNKGGIWTPKRGVKVDVLGRFVKA